MNAATDPRPHLLIFAREPVLGRVKTRLAAGIGAEAALAAYRELLALTAAAVAAAQVPATVWLAEAPADEAAATIPAAAPPRPEWPGLPWRVQPPADSLGTRMAHAFGAAFGAGAGRVVVIGTDCPGLSAALLTRAFDQLLTHDVVIGPAADGGYYLLGMNRLEVEFFKQKLEHCHRAARHPGRRRPPGPARSAATHVARRRLSPGPGRLARGREPGLNDDVATHTPR
ncbi:MAG: TIGR04282 family arsenosugar biosynthesis glycosyltransferase [Hymenobacter sp.]